MTARFARTRAEITSRRFLADFYRRRGERVISYGYLFCLFLEQRKFNNSAKGGKERAGKARALFICR